jgi:hypothetical protein
MGSELYNYTLVDSHPKMSTVKRVKTCILIAEKALGKYLPDNAIIHHANENKLDDRNSNLVICENETYHRLLHKRLRAYKACGKAWYMKCKICKQYDDPKSMSYSNNTYWHKECARIRSQKQRDSNARVGE